MKLGPVRRTLAVACVLPILLAGCSEAEPTPQVPDPAPSEPSTPSATETGPVKPTLPPEADGDGVEAAEAFVEHYFAALTFAQMTGRTNQLGQLALSGCLACSGSLEAIRKVYDAGGTIRGGDFFVRRVKASAQPGSNQGGSTYVARATVAHTAQRIEGSGTELDGSGPSGSDRFQLLLVRDAGEWHVGQWSLL
jgi:hypothetical protein